MGSNKQDTLEAIIRAAKNMASQKNSSKSSTISSQPGENGNQKIQPSAPLQKPSVLVEHSDALERQESELSSLDSDNPGCQNSLLQGARFQDQTALNSTYHEQCQEPPINEAELAKGTAEPPIDETRAEANAAEPAMNKIELSVNEKESVLHSNRLIGNEAIPAVQPSAPEAAEEPSSMDETAATVGETVSTEDEAATEAHRAVTEADEVIMTDGVAGTANGAATALPPNSYNRSPAAIHNVGIHFLEFAVAFLTLAKCQYQRDTDVKVNSLPFFTLVALDNWAEEDYTMSELAEKLQITKQQFSRLINDLEEKGLVERIHDKENRRRVYIRICDLGRAMMEDLKQDMLNCTLHGLRSYTAAELAEIDFCICRLTELMEKFNTEPK